MTFMQSGVSWLADQMKTHAGVSVTVIRGASETELTAVVTSQEYEVTDGNGFPIKVLSRDYTFTTSELPFEFRPGDVVREEISGDTHDYAAMLLGDKPCWEWQDSNGVMTVVHSKQVSVT